MFLAMKISYINEVANLCEKIEVDIQVVTSAMGKDSRISSKFLDCGPGYGRNCFPIKLIEYMYKHLNKKIWFYKYYFSILIGENYVKFYK